MDSTTTNDAPEQHQPEAEADSAPKKERARPRKLSMTDKIREAREVNVNKVERLQKKAEQLRTELASTVHELNEARQEIARADAVLPPSDKPDGYVNGHAQGETVEAHRA